MARAGGGPPPFSYDDIPNQLLRINSLEGSLAFSGAVLTGVTDVSPVGGTVNVTGSPTYTATDSGLNGAPSFTIVAASSVIAPNINRASIRFLACVMYRPGTGAYFAVDGDELAGRFFVALFPASSTVQTSASAFAVGGEPSAGRKRMLFPNDNATACLWNGVSLGTQPVGSASGNGLTFGASYLAASLGARVAFFMACSSVPSAPQITALEAKLITDFG